MKRVLSSASLKLLFLTRMLGGLLGAGVGLYVLIRMQSSVGTRRELVVAPAVVIAMIWSVLVVHDWRTWRRLKQVAVDDRFLYVSDYSDSEEVTIPLSDIVRVTQWRGRTLRTVTVYLRSPSKFGQRIQFQPKIEAWGWAWKEDKVVQELRTLANVQPEKLRGERGSS
jgi:hypothetical protein